MLNELAKQVNNLAHGKGWYLSNRSFGEIIALIHSELSHAMEEHRDNRRADDLFVGERVFRYVPNDLISAEILAGHGHKPEGVGIELADAVIRIADYCHEAGIDIDAAIRLKMIYNETRAYKHSKGQK
jgi:hypothetical protein